MPKVKELQWVEMQDKFGFKAKTPNQYSYEIFGSTINPDKFNLSIENINNCFDFKVFRHNTIDECKEHAQKIHNDLMMELFNKWYEE